MPKSRKKVRGTDSEEFLSDVQCITMLLGKAPRCRDARLGSAGLCREAWLCTERQTGIPRNRCREPSFGTWACLSGCRRPVAIRGQRKGGREDAARPRLRFGDPSVLPPVPDRPAG